ncbi:CopG family transcriptional regulator [Candidatus Bathyarchaeota archaeon]|nr:CopG family transcriptional regulator [Candidatus Bathyarchaeota archaeon]
MVKRIMVTLDDDQYEILKKLRGFGEKDAEKLRNIFIAYLSEKSYLKEAQKSTL